MDLVKAFLIVWVPSFFLDLCYGNLFYVENHNLSFGLGRGSGGQRCPGREQMVIWAIIFAGSDVDRTT